MIWFFLPVAMVITNDIFAYLCGITFGRTPLIKISPKKTWEGFLGAWFFTVILGFLYTNIMARYTYFTCPVNVSQACYKLLHLLTIIGSRRKYLDWPRLQAESRFHTQGLHTSNPDSIWSQHSDYLLHLPCPIPRVCSRNLRLTDRSIWRLLRFRTQANLQDQGLRRLYSGPRWYD